MREFIFYVCGIFLYISMFVVLGNYTGYIKIFNLLMIVCAFPLGYALAQTANKLKL